MDQTLKTAIAEYAKEAGNSPSGKSAMAEIIVKMTEPQHLALEIFRQFMPVRSLNPGDSLMHKVKRGRYPVRSMVPGTSHLMDAVYQGDKVAFLFDSLIAGTNANLWEIRSGDIGTVQEMRANLRKDVIDGIVSKVFNLLTTVWNTTDTPSNYIDASSTGITQVQLDAMIENILEKNGSVRAIFGQRRALLPIYDFAGYKGVEITAGATGTVMPLPQLEEYYRTNRVTSYKNIALVELDQIFASDLPDVNRKLIPTDKVLVIGADAGQIVTFGGFEYQDYTDFRTQPANYVLHGWQQYGMIVDDVEAIGVIKTNT